MGNPAVDYYITLSDTYGDGWNGNILSIRQNGINKQFGAEFKSQKTYGPFIMALQTGVPADIVVSTIGSYTS